MEGAANRPPPLQREGFVNSSDDKAVMRARDFWAALLLFGVAAFFLRRTTFIPLFGHNRAGVSGADWYNSAALVPFGIFGGLLVLSLVLLTISIREGGARSALSAAGIGWNRAEAHRFVTLAAILFFYIVGLVPRVDFILASGLLITALIFGYHHGHARRMSLAAAVVAFAGSYALVRNLPQSDWGRHDDDLVTLALWICLTLWALVQGRGDRVARVIPVIAVAAPLILVCVMAFGFRQNVPNRGGLIFKQIEYHYYVSLKPLWSR